MTDQTCLVTGCGRPVLDAFVCSTCGAQLEADLGDIIDHAEALDDALARLTAFGDRLNRRTDAKVIPFDGRASDVKRFVRGVLAGWVGLVLDQRYHGMSNPPGSTSQLAEGSVAPLAKLLLANLEWLRHHEAGHEAATEIATAAERIRTVVDAPPERWYAGVCEVCGIDMYARADLQVLVCECGRDYDVRARRDWLLGRVEDVLASAVDMSRALTSLDQPVTAERIRKWRERGQILEHGAGLYRVGDVRELLARARRA